MQWLFRLKEFRCPMAKTRGGNRLNRRIAVEWASALGELACFHRATGDVSLPRCIPSFVSTDEEEYRKLFGGSQYEIENRFHLKWDRVRIPVVSRLRTREELSLAAQEGEDYIGKSARRVFALSNSIPACFERGVSSPAMIQAL